MKIKKITVADRKRVKALVATLKEGDKDQLIADLILFADRARIVLDEVIRNADLTAKEKREVEDSITVGPQWLRYSRRVKRQK